MAMSQVIKSFIANVSKFEKFQDYDSIISSLQILSATNDLSVFDIGSLEVAEFYRILYDLLTHRSNESELVWSIVSVLQVAVRNPSVCFALGHNYHFIHPLTTLLDDQLSSERKLVLLNIIQELTYGVVICWQEAHLPKLIKLLVDIITSNDRELIPVALGVMVNLCYKNKPAIYTLMNSVDIKAFLQKILKLRREHIETTVQVCKLVMVLNKLSGNVPDTEILAFVRMSFLKIDKAFRCGNKFLMRHIVDFFHDAKENEHGRKVLLTYPTYLEETEKLINTLSMKEVPSNWQCVQRLVEFFHQLVDLELLSIMPLFIRMAQCLLPWIQMEGVASPILELLSSILHQCKKRDESVYNDMCSCLENHLQMFVEMLHKRCNSDSSSSEVRATLTSLLHLLRELATNPSLSTNIACAVDKTELKKLLLPLMSLSSDDSAHLFHQPVTALYVEVLSFVSELSMDDKEWIFLYSDLLQKKQILKALAVALYSGSYEVKKQILYLAGTTSFSKDCLTVLSKCLTDLHQLFVFTPNTNSHNTDKEISCSQSQVDFSPSFTKSQGESLNGLIEKLENLHEKNKIQDVSLAEIIELYNYKLSEMKRAERSLQSSLEASDNHRSQLSQRVAQLCAETGRLHQLLYLGQQTLEGSQMELADLRGQLQTAKESASSSHTKFKQLKQDVASKSMIIKDQSGEILKLRQTNEENMKKYEELEQNALNLKGKTEEQNRLIQKLEQTSVSLGEKIEELNRVVQKLETEKSELQTTQSRLEEKLTARDQLILEKDVLIEKKIGQIQTLEQEIANQQARAKGLEKTVKDKEKEISAQHNQLLDLERMRKIIFDITGGKKNNF